MKHKLTQYFRTSKRLQAALDDVDRIDGLKELLDSWRSDKHNFDPESPCDLDPIYYNEIKYFCVSSFTTLIRDDDFSYYICMYFEGYSLPWNYGDFTKIDGTWYMLLCSLPLPQEEEYQANDGKYAYQYIGPNGLLVWRPLECEKGIFVERINEY